MKKFNTEQEASDYFLKKDTNNFIQWKGTDICMDFWCDCGHQSHFDDYFAYYIKCNGCNRFFALEPRVQLVEVLQEPDNYLQDEDYGIWKSLDEIRDQKIKDILNEK